jgi:DNA-binding GntR family transcriptional regulator
VQALPADGRVRSAIHMHEFANAQRSAASQVVAHVKESIRSGRLAPGQRLLESELTGRLGVSRGPVREALAQLQVEGFIDVAPHRGARVHQMSRDEMVDLFHVRALLAAEAARLAASRIGEGDGRARLEAELERQHALRTNSDLSAYAAANVGFHTLIDEICGNQLLASLLDQLQTRVGPFLSLAQSRGRQRALEHHVAIAEAILDGDGAAAARAMRRHIKATLQTIMELPQSWFE